MFGIEEKKAAFGKLKEGIQKTGGINRWNLIAAVVIGLIAYGLSTVVGLIAAIVVGGICVLVALVMNREVAGMVAKIVVLLIVSAAIGGIGYAIGGLMGFAEIGAAVLAAPTLFIGASKIN